MLHENRVRYYLGRVEKHEVLGSMGYDIHNPADLREIEEGRVIGSKAYEQAKYELAVRLAQEELVEKGQDNPPLWRIIQKVASDPNITCEQRTYAHKLSEKLRGGE